MTAAQVAYLFKIDSTGFGVFVNGQAGITYRAGRVLSSLLLLVGLLLYQCLHRGALAGVL